MNSARSASSVSPASPPSSSSVGSDASETTITEQCGWPPPGTARSRLATSSSQRVHSPTLRARLSSCSTASSMRVSLVGPAAVRRPGGQAPGLDEAVLADEGAGRAGEHEHELAAEGREDDVQVCRTRRRCTCASGWPQLAASRAPMSMTPATWAATASALKPASASAATTNPSREMSRAATMPGRLPVGGELRGEDVGLVGHEASRAVSSWAAHGGREGLGGGRVGEGSGEAVAPAGQFAEEHAGAGDGGAVRCRGEPVQRKLDERVAAHEQPAGLTPREPDLDVHGHALAAPAGW